jgi:hypothetical protein
VKVPKKRGRPSKADLAAREKAKEQDLARGETDDMTETRKIGRKPSSTCPGCSAPPCHSCQPCRNIGWKKKCFKRRCSEMKSPTVLLLGM